MQILLLIPGLALLAAAFYDALQTTLGRGGGPLTKAAGRGVVWAVHTPLGKRIGGAVFDQLGLLVLLTVISLWTLLLWAGWTLVFMASDGAVVSASTGDPAGFWSRVYFVGYCLVTLGLGDYQPVGSGWQIATAWVALSGLFVLTLAISYVLPVLQAAVQRRAVAAWLWGLGETTEDVVRTMWSPGRDCSALDQHLIGLTPTLTLMAQQHIAYPVLHQFHGDKRREALAPSLAAFDEALSIIEHGLDGGCVSPGALRPVRSAIAAVLDRLGDQSVDAADEPPPPPSLAGLRRDGYAVVSDAEFARALEEDECSDRRCLLLGLVEAEGWEWSDVVGDGSDDDSDGDGSDDRQPGGDGSGRVEHDAVRREVAEAV